MVSVANWLQFQQILTVRKKKTTPNGFKAGRRVQQYRHILTSQAQGQIHLLSIVPDGGKRGPNQATNI